METQDQQPEVGTYLRSHQNQTARSLVAAIFLAFGGFMILGNMAAGLIISTRVQKLDSMESIRSQFSTNEFFVINLIPFVIGFLMLVWSAKVLLRERFQFLISIRPQFSMKRFLVGLGTWLGLSLVLFGIDYFRFPAMYQWNANGNETLILLGITLFIVPLQTGFEELLFRGVLFKLLGKSKLPGIALVLINAVLFASLHLANPEVQELGWIAIVYYVFSGVFLALITLMDDGLELSWGFHFANNVFGVFFLTNDWQAFQTDALFKDISQPDFSWSMLINLFVWYPLFILLFAKIYKWKHWKQRLLA